MEKRTPRRLPLATASVAFMPDWESMPTEPGSVSGVVHEGDAAAGGVDAHAVGADQADAGAVEQVDQLGFEAGAFFLAGFAEAGGEEVDDGDAFFGGVLDQAEDVLRGDGGDQVVDVAGDVGEGFVEDGAVVELAAAGVEGVDVWDAVEIADAAEEGLATAPAGAACGDAGDGDGFGGEGGGEGGLRVQVARFGATIGVGRATTCHGRNSYQAGTRGVYQWVR